MIRSLRIRYFKKISQTAPTAPQDVRRLQGVNSYLFGPQSWTFINQLVNEINNSLFILSKGKKLGNQSLNFLTAVKNPSGETGYVGSLKNMFNLSLFIWPMLTIDRKNRVYSAQEAKQLATSILAKVNSYTFPEPEAKDIKPHLATILNNWIGVLNSSQ